MHLHFFLTKTNICDTSLQKYFPKITLKSPKKKSPPATTLLLPLSPSCHYPNDTGISPVSFSFFSLHISPYFTKPQPISSPLPLSSLLPRTNQDFSLIGRVNRVKEKLVLKIGLTELEKSMFD